MNINGMKQLKRDTIADNLGYLSNQEYDLDNMNILQLEKLQHVIDALHNDLTTLLNIEYMTKAVK